MYKLLRLALGLCNHEWETLRETRLTLTGDDGRVGTRYILRCTKCGNVKKEDLI